MTKQKVSFSLILSRRTRFLSGANFIFYLAMPLVLALVREAQPPFDGGELESF